MDVIVTRRPSAQPLADIVITWHGWDSTSRAGSAAVAHVTAASGAEEVQ